MFGDSVGNQNSGYSRNVLFTLSLSLLWSVLIVAVQYSDTGHQINDRLASTLEFRFRETLGKSPQLSPKIRIFGFDDKTLSILKRPELYIEEWAEGIKRLASYKPKVIIIDKMFCILYDPNGTIHHAMEEIKNVDVPVVVGSFISDKSISYRHTLNLNKNIYHMPWVEKSGVWLGDKFNDKIEQEPWFVSKDADIYKGPDDPFNKFKDFRGKYLYGPTPEFQSVFTWVGHLQYSGHTRASPYIRIKDEFAIPHASLFAADRFSIVDGQIEVNQKQITLNQDGDVVVNLSAPHSYYKGLRRLNLILNDNPRRQLINEGDIVLLLLNMYTGGTDFHLTPFGYAPGGFILAAMINSVISGQWLSEAGKVPGLLILVLGSLLGGVLGVLGGALFFWISIILGSMLIAGIGIFLFSFAGLIVPWFWVVLAFGGSGIIVFAEKSRYTEKRARKLQLVEAERKLLAKELQEASVMAEAYRPDALPRWPHFLIGGYHKPIHAASGDWYAFESSDSGQYYHMVLCDITGHGVQAALVVSACKTLLGNIKSMLPDMFEKKDFMVRYMTILNGILWKQGQGQHVTTLAGLTFEPAMNKVYYLTAGHPSPLIRNEKNWQQKPKPLLSRHNPIGICQDCQPVLKQSDFKSGDELIVYTDGIPIHELRRSLKNYEPRTAQNMPNASQSLYEEAWRKETQRSGKIPDDDVSMIWFKKNS